MNDHDLDHLQELSRKEMREDRKMRRQKDRSKFKKTAEKQFSREREQEEEQKLKEEGLVEGKVVKVLPEAVSVFVEGKVRLCTLRGALKKERRKEKNLVVVGDDVLIEPLGEEEGAIHWVLSRKTVLSRADNLSRRFEHLIAANVDQVFITVSVVSPSLKPSLIDRYIIAARQGGMIPIVIMNKIDLLDSSKGDVEEQKSVYEEALEAYKKIGIRVLCISCRKKTGLDLLKKVMEGKTSVFSGQSGVGKSSLINEILGLDLPVKKTVEKTGKGSHTTTTSQLVPVKGGGFCVDTPGIKSFGLLSLEKEQLDAYFVEIAEASKGCRFSNCTHTHEKICGVKQSLENGEISALRYRSYLALLEEIDQEHLRR